jgi:predicted dehydrogenase
MIRLGVIGYGYWGPNLARAAAEADSTQIAGIADLSAAARDRAGRRHPSARLFADWHEMLADPAVDAVMIATPVATHFEIALAALRAGKHVLVEKPMADAAANAALLIEEAAKRTLTLMVDHTFVYTPAVRALRDLVTAGSLGDIYYYDSTRVNLGLFQHDVNVIWDLAVHDLAIMDYVLPGQQPVAVSATGLSHVPGKPENVAYLTVFFAENLIAHVNVNWLAPVKIRQTLVGGSRKMIVYDDLEPSEKIKIYDRGVAVSDDPQQIHDRLISYRVGDMASPALSAKEALITEVEHFAACIETGARPLTDGESGLRIVEMLTAASRSSRLRGQPIELGALKEAS